MTFSATTIAQNVGIGNTTFTPNASSLLELRSTSAGFLMPRMTEAQRDAISNPATGLMIYQTNNTPGYYYYTGSAWESFGAAASIDNMGDHTATQNLVVGTGLGMTDTDEDTKVQVEQLADEDKIRFRVAGSEAMMINTDRNVGIGTDAPSRNLQIQVNNNGTNFPLFLRNSNNTNGSNGVGIAFNSEQNGDWVKAALFHERTAGFGVGKMHFLMDDVSDNGSVTLSQSRMTVTAQGRVGIGTTSPDRALHVRSSTSGANVVTVQNTQSNGWSSIDFHNQSGSLSATFGYANSGTSGIFTGKAYMNSYNNDFVLTRNSGENSLFIEGSTGDIGFNTNNPTARLDVNGDAKIRDLAGSGTRMVVTDANGNLSSQAIPSGGGGGFGSGTTLNRHMTNDVTNLNVSGVSIIRFTTNGDDHYVKGLTGGVAGQVICIVNRDSSKKVKFKKNQGTQRFREDLDVDDKEGAIIMYDGQYWYVISKH